MKIPFAVQSYKTRSKPVSQQRLVNAYLEAAPETAKSQIPVYNTPGIKAWITVGDGPIRGAHKLNGKLYVVSGPELYSVTSTGTTTKIGNVLAASERCMMTAGNFLVIQTDGKIYYYDGTTLLTVDDADFQQASSVAWLGGYYIYPKPDTDVFFVSGSEAPNSIDPLDFASAEALPDNIVQVMVDHNDLILFGEETSEIWALQGADFPFIRLQNGVLEYGCAAKHSPAKLDNSVYWFAHDLSVRVLRSNIPTRVSNDAMETEIATYSTISDAIGIAMTVDGRSSYALVFPTEKKTWQLSVNTGLWNELESYDQGRWRVDGYVQAFNKHLVWDSTTNRLGELDKDTYKEWDDQIIFTMMSNPIADGNSWLFHESLYLDFETGDTSVLDVSAVTKTITGITQANPAVVTSASHGFTNGEQVYITNVVGMTEVNGQYFIVASAATNTFALQGVDSTGFTAYTSGGTAAEATERAAQAMIRWSDDGKNWGPAYQRALGRIGECSERVAMNQSLGRAKNRVYEVAISDPVRRRFIGAEGEIRRGGY